MASELEATDDEMTKACRILVIYLYRWINVPKFGLQYEDDAPQKVMFLSRAQVCALV